MLDRPAKFKLVADQERLTLLFESINRAIRVVRA
jgi:hypothetical protein